MLVCWSIKLAKSLHAMLQVSKSLTSLPSEIWRNVLLNWLGNLSQIVRVDCAYCLTSSENPIRVAYSEGTFQCCEGLYMKDAADLERILQWMYARKVYFNRLDLVDFNQLQIQHWDELLLWSGQTVRSLTFIDEITGSNEPSKLLLLASKHIEQLQTLNVVGNSHRNATAIEQLLRNNSGIIRSLNIQLEDAEGLFLWRNISEQFPQLRSLQCANWDRDFLCAFLRRCPRLTALSISGDVQEPGSLVAAITGGCPLLRRLKLQDVDDLTADSMLQIARGCPHLNYLSLSGIIEFDFNELPAVVSAMPALHTLKLFMEPEETLLAIAARGHAALRIIDAGTEFTFAGLQTLTSALPQLTGLSINSVYYEDGVDWMSLFEHCGGLRSLHFTSRRLSKAHVDGFVFDSVAKHCTNLHTLIIDNHTTYDSNSMNAFVEACPQLRVLRVRNSSDLRVPANRPYLSVKEDDMVLEEWLPKLVL